MVEEINGQLELLLTPMETKLWDQQVEARNSADTSKADAAYQNSPRGDERCEVCTMFVPGFHSDPGGYCMKVYAIRGPEGMIFPNGWCKFFTAETD